LNLCYSIFAVGVECLKFDLLENVGLFLCVLMLTSFIPTVVYHDGKEATKGHYVTEVHHSGTGSWLRFDDSIVRVVETQPFKYNLPRMPYLLLYRKLNV
jgi:hypothetical protein